MKHDKALRKQRQRRRFRVRKRLDGTPERPRLCVHRTHKHIYCQLIDDSQGRTIAAASTRDKDLRSAIQRSSNKDAAVVVGQTIAEKAKAAGIQAICLDRGSCKYHGRVAALADAAREAGLTF